jgi:hypothetical protein
MVSDPIDHVTDTGGGRRTETEVFDLKLEGMNLHPVNATHPAVPFFARKRIVPNLSGSALPPYCPVRVYPKSSTVADMSSSTQDNILHCTPHLHANSRIILDAAVLAYLFRFAGFSGVVIFFCVDKV